MTPGYPATANSRASSWPGRPWPPPEPGADPAAEARAAAKVDLAKKMRGYWR
uniref:Uncharacterized protein n=1 Tax=Ralstonia solanacearum TaxID=305 RepID=A0A0S4VC67_RALSL|nr:protein of unknown function [Ralstonia solanacearum]